MTFRMGAISGFALEVKSAALFAVIALVLSFITGIAAGNNLANAFITSIVISLVFAAIGYGAVVVLRRFVPELIESLGIDSPGAKDFEDVQVPSEEAPGAAPADGEPPEGQEKKTDEKLEKEFAPFKSGDFKNLSSTTATGDGKLGKHIVSEQKTVKYEPKIIAEAIRTMIRRDDKD